MKTILFDFDGVIHNHSTNKWKSVNIIEGNVVAGMKDCIKKLRENYKIVIFSSRCLESGGKEAIEKWLDKNNIEVDDITDKKLSYASMIVDDRAVNFNGDVNKLISDIDKFQVWTKKAVS